MKTSKQLFKDILTDVKTKGQLVAPRGLTILEIENYSYELPAYQRFMSFTHRHLNLDYIKQEFMWYLKGDRFDASICKYASMWNNLVNKDGSINSNYGQYVFGGQKQFDRVIDTLKNDKESRRASMMILNSEHLNSDTHDFPCTYSINFRIRNGYLNMTVRMRSQDGIYGMGNDAPTFSFIHEMMFNALLEYYPDLKYGVYHHSADSFHIYDRHFKMLDMILEDDEYVNIDCPKINGPEEVRFLRACQFDNVPEEFEFTKWLTSPKAAE